MNSKKTINTKAAAKPALLPKLRFPEFREAEGWDIEYLGGICEPQQWTTISSTELVDRGYPVYGANGFIGYYTDFNHEFETVAVTCRGSTCGEVTLIPPKSYITGNSMCLDGIDAVQNSYHFVYQLLKHRGFDDVISGSAQPQIVGNAIKRLRIAIPKKPEQQKIAECLGSVDELIGAESRKLNALKSHKKGLMQQLFPGTPTSSSAGNKNAGEDASAPSETQPRLRFPEFQYKGEWKIRIVSQLAKVTTGAKDTQNKVEDGRYPFFVRSQTVERIDSFSYDGEAVLTSGDGVGVGKNFHYIKGKFDFHQRVYCIYDFTKDVSGMFFYLYFSEHFGDRVMRMSAKNSVDSVRMAMITEMPVMLPSLPEQHRIADCLSSLDALIAAETQKLEALKTHKKGLMQQLFPNPEEVEA